MVRISADIAVREEVRKCWCKQQMLLNISEDLHLDADQSDVWKLLRDTPRLTRLLPGVESVTPIDGNGSEAYAAKVTDKIGPFKLAMNLEVRVTDILESSSLKASLKGGDAIGLNRVTGSIEIALAPAAAGTQMRFDASVEILGKLATLGAVPIRRRTKQSFAEFARSIQTQFAKERS